MNDAQKRREALLKNTRKLYDSGEKGTYIHPRYQSRYAFSEKEKKEEPSSLGIRILFSMLLFLVFVLAERHDTDLYCSMAACIMGK